MSKIVVTGGSGKAGRAVAADLRERGYDVTNVDIAASLEPDAPELAVDLTDLGQALAALEGAEAVIHLAAIPAPNILTPEETFRINMMSTYNVFSAASQHRVGKVVWASSETLIGIPLNEMPPSYAPIDEEHPRLPQSHYALSKLAGEVLADQFNRWTGIPFVSLRYSNIMEEADYARRFPGFWEDPASRAWNLWGYVDARDVAQCTRLALDTETSGSEAFLVAAADTCMTQTSNVLMAEYFPQVPIREDLAFHQTLLAIDKARRVLGYRPDHTWRNYIEA